jgi:hypothetical protein
MTALGPSIDAYSHVGTPDTAHYPLAPGSKSRTWRRGRSRPRGCWQPGESLFGVGCGLAVGAVAGLTGVHAGPVPAAAFGLIVGALAGATLRPYVRLVSLPIVLLVRVLPDRRGLVECPMPRLGGRLPSARIGFSPFEPVTHEAGQGRRLGIGRLSSTRCS